MKKMIFTLMAVVLFATASTSAFAQENKSDFKNGFTLGAGFSVSPNLQGGAIDFGFGLYKKNNFYIRNHVEVNFGWLDANYNYVGFRERIIFGNQFNVTDNIAIRPYGVVDFNFSMIESSSKQFDEAPFILEPRVAIGFELMLTQKGRNRTLATGYFIETSVGEQFLTKSENVTSIGRSMVTFTIGMRFYF